jgi:Zn-dependent protease
VTHAQIWLAIAHLTGFLNLFNLIPIWQLDGSRGFHALSRTERWMVVGAIGLALWLTGQRLLWIVGGVAAWRATQKAVGPGDQRTLATFVLLVLAVVDREGGRLSEAGHDHPNERPVTIG